MGKLSQVAELMQERWLRKPVEVDEIALERARQRGAEAEELMKHPLLIEAFASIEATYMHAWRTSAMEDLDRRERAWSAVLLLADLKNFLYAVMRQGEGAAERIRLAAEN